MHNDEKNMIQGLFGRLREAEKTAPPRDQEAESFIRDSVAAQPGAPYYMAQTIIVQEQALEAARQRIEELEGQTQRSSGGLLGGLFGGGQPQPRARSAGVPSVSRGAAAQGDVPAGSPWNSAARNASPAQRGGGGGFLAGAAQTAVGVAGGMMLGSMLGGLFSGGDEAVAAEMEPDLDPGMDEAGMEDAGMDEGFGDFEL
ncbi:DUF2076 domain-containing protein [Aureimonas populi]|uniref:DUF2076 domain-containing protein n=1 Tax=Aureimonas populi TaxID=1701758 RepID=A0ABW5CPJ6_9HYPH|nr:DUF2076 domain-containing protein [Aureimonas populi]